MVFKPQAFNGRNVNPVDLEANPIMAMETRVADALARAADIDAAEVVVIAAGTAIVLKGTVTYPEEIEIAEDIASRVTGVASVDNRLSAVISNDNARTL